MILMDDPFRVSPTLQDRIPPSAVSMNRDLASRKEFGKNVYFCVSHGFQI